MDKALLSLLGGAALGAGAMYFYDPKHGAKRRAHAGDAAVQARRKLARAASSTSHTVRSRAAQVMGASREMLGSAAQTKARLWTPRTRALLATLGVGLAALAGARPQA